VTFADPSSLSGPEDELPGAPGLEPVPVEPPGYLWRPIEPPAPPPLEALPPRPPRLIPNLGHALVFFALLVPSFIGGYILSFFFLLGFHLANPHTLVQEMTHNVVYAMSMQAAWYAVQWALAALVFSLWWHRSMTSGIHWNNGAALRWFWRLALVGVATGLVITIAGNFLPMPKAPPILEDMTKSATGAWILMAFGITVAPLTEELAFRGFLLPGLINTFRWMARREMLSEEAARALGIPIAIVLTSIPFALLHAQQVSDSWGPLLLIGMVSVILCIVRLVTDSVATGVLVHATYNFTLFAGLLVQTDGFRHLDKLKG